MKINKCLNPVHKTVAFSIAIIFGLMVIVGFLQVTNRYFFNSSLSWSEEFQKFAHIWIICLTIPVAYKNSAHLGMDIIYKKLSLKNQYLFNQLVNSLWLFNRSIISHLFNGVDKGSTNPNQSGSWNQHGVDLFRIVYR